MLRATLGLVGVLAAGGGVAIAWQGLQLMGYDTPLAGAILFGAGLGLCAMTIASNRNSRRWLRQRPKAQRVGIGLLVAGVIVLSSAGLFSYAPKRTTAPDQAAPAPHDPPNPVRKYSNTQKLVMLQGPGADPSKDETLRLDDALSLILAVPYGPTTVTLAESLGPTIFKDSPTRTEQYVVLGRSWTFTTITRTHVITGGTRAFQVTLETIQEFAKTEGRPRRLEYVFQIREL
jgi:hypothetical protein